MFEPARIITAAEERLQRNPQTMEALDKARANIANAVELTPDRLGLPTVVLR